eukprot:15437253-Alexandrium_andersonii.AAC.1
MARTPSDVYFGQSQTNSAASAAGAAGAARSPGVAALGLGLAAMLIAEHNCFDNRTKHRCGSLGQSQQPLVIASNHSATAPRKRASPPQV